MSFTFTGSDGREHVIDTEGGVVHDWHFEADQPQPSLEPSEETT